jgi:hypothetical protein
LFVNAGIPLGYSFGSIYYDNAMNLLGFLGETGKKKWQPEKRGKWGYYRFRRQSWPKIRKGARLN